VWNHWGIHNSPNEYAKPERFWPDRFLNEDLDKPIKGHLGFGTGMSGASLLLDPLENPNPFVC